MTMTGQRLGLRLFLEGIEVPVISAQVQMGINAPATASIQVVPTDGILSLKPRTMVHLFFWDYTLDVAGTPSTTTDPQVLASLYHIEVDAAKDLISSQDVSGDRFDLDLRGYKLFFCGEIIGIMMAKSPVGRQAVLQCSDFSTYWDTTYQFFVSYSGSGFLGTSAAVWAGADNMFDDLTSGHTSVMDEYLRSAPQTPGLTKIKGLMGGIISLLEAMGGVANHTSGVNDFFTIAELKNHILQQIVAEENDDTATRLFEEKTFMDWLTRGMSSMGSLVTFRDMIKLLFTYVYYEVVPNPCAMYTKSKDSTTKKMNTYSGSGLSDELSDKIRALAVKVATYRDWKYKADGQERKETVLGIQVADEIEAILAMTKNSRIEQLQQNIKYLAAEQLITNATTGYQPSAPEQLFNQAAASVPAPPKKTSIPAKTADFLELAKGEVKDLRDVQFSPTAAELNKANLIVMGSLAPNLIRQNSTPASKSGSKTKGNKVFFEDNKGSKVFFKEPVPQDPPVFSSNRKVWAKVYDFLMKALQGDGKVTGQKDVYVEGELPMLGTQIFRPDCFFAAAPRCNVLFPDQYTQFQFSRSFLQECTRLRLSTDLTFGINQGTYGLLDVYHFAPTTTQLMEMAKKQGNSSIRVLLPWEIYSGILPKFETMHEVNYIVEKINKNNKNTQISGPASEYAQRTANFNYLRYRFSARSCEISAKFTPWLVCGFPTVILDKPFILTPERRDEVLQAVPENFKDDMSEFVRTAARKFNAPTQYIGMIAGMSHSVSQEGGHTSITMTHARTHRITDDDFLDTISSEITNTPITEIVPTELDAEKLIAEGNWKMLNFLRDITPQNLAQVAVSLAQRQDQEDEGAAGQEQIPLESRPASLPKVVDSFAGLNDLRSATKTPETVPVTSDSYLSIRGHVIKGNAPKGETQILIPSPGGKLGPGSKGPLGGKIVQVACAGDPVTLTAQAVALVGKNLATKGVTPPKNKKVKTSDAVLVKEFQTDPGTGKLLINGAPVAKADVIYYWRKATIYEKATYRKRSSKTIPIEEGLRPPWFSNLYSNWFIGKEIYEKFFGCGSIVDQALYVTPNDGLASFGTSREKQKKLLADIRACTGDENEIKKIMDSALADSIADVPDIESAVDELAYIYGEVKRKGLDVNRFIQDYTRRPIATLEEILGSADLEYINAGDAIALVSGTPGFHSAAVYDAGGQLRGLLTNPDLKIPRFRKGHGKKAIIHRDLDPRPGRLEKVRDYVGQLHAATGSLGVGLEG
jgi:hypothetical protein